MLYLGPLRIRLSRLQRRFAKLSPHPQRISEVSRSQVPRFSAHLFDRPISGCPNIHINYLL